LADHPRQHRADDGPAPEILKDQSVLIEGDRIARIAPAADLPAPEGAVVVPGRGRYLLPGLIDAHVHVWDEAELSAYLASGVTTVRNASGMPFHLAFAKAIDEGRLPGPRLLTTGPILNGRGPNTQVNHQIVNTPEEAHRAVQQQHDQGYRHLKVYSNLSRESYEAILAQAKRLGMTVMGHTPEGPRDAGIPRDKPFRIDFRELLDDPLVSIEHMESIVWHGLRDELDEPRVRQLARDIAASRIAVTPTLVAHHNLVMVAQSRGQYLKRRGVEWLNPFISAIEQESYAHWSKQPADGRVKQDEFYLRATGIFQQEGVTLLAGTDAGIFTHVPGQSLIDELALLVRSGLGPYQALATATRHPAQAFGLGDRIGQVTAGRTADLILLDADPTRDIAAVQAMSGLVVRGQWHDAAAIARLKQQAAATSAARTEQRVREGLAAQGGSLD
jgi:imidazolonepropionase-like amidohydrolase